MRRQLHFDYSLTENNYIIQEGGNNIFCINGNTLKFEALEFYNGVYAGNKSTAIDFENKITETSPDSLKKGEYIFNWIKEIFDDVEKKLPEPEKKEKLENKYQENEADFICETCSAPKAKKMIRLFDWPACAGDGFYFDQADVPFEEIEANNENADYAVKISGRSMEPTIKDGSIVEVKQVNVLSNGDIGIFSINGEIMCKRYCTDSASVVLKPDNQSEEFCDVDGSKVEYVIQGKVLIK